MARNEQTLFPEQREDDVLVECYWIRPLDFTVEKARSTEFSFRFSASSAVGLVQKHPDG